MILAKRILKSLI